MPVLRSKCAGALDQPGEWCADAEDGKLYFWPPSDIAAGEAVVPVLPTVFAISKAKWIRVAGLTFTETATGGRGGVRCESAAHIQFEKNRLLGHGGRALDVWGNEGPCHDVLIRGNEIAFSGGSGVYVGGSARDCRILDNDVHHCGVFDKYAAGIELPFYGAGATEVGPHNYTDHILIAHNDVHDLPRDGIQLGANPYGRNIVDSTASSGPRWKPSTREPFAATA